MGGTKSKLNYSILYGEEKSGKTLLQYSMQSDLNFLQVIEPTKGFNYEEVDVRDSQLGIFDVAGDPQQYEVVNVITKSVSIGGVIFVVSLDNLKNLDRSREMLKLVLGNNHITKKLSLLVLYNYKDSATKERLSWIDEDMLNSRMKLEPIKEKYKLKNVISYIMDVSVCNTEDRENFSAVLEKFVDNFEREKTG